MRFASCILASGALHAIALGLIPVVGPALWRASATGESEPVAVRVLDEPPIIANAPPHDPLAPPIFQPSEEAKAFREGMGALAPEPRPRNERPGIASTNVRRNSPDFGMSPSDAANYPSAPDPGAGTAIAPTETGPDGAASEAPAEGWGTEGTRFSPEGGALDPTRAAAPGRPTGDIGVGAGPGGNAPEGAGPGPAPGGPPPAPEGPGTGVDAPGTGTAGPGTGSSGSGHSGSGTGSDEGGGQGSTPPPVTTPPPAPQPARLVAVASPSFPPTKEMQRLEIHGTVSVRVSIDTSGTITSASVVSGSGHPSYDSQAAQWVRSRWRYKWVGGTPEGGVTRTVQVRF